MNQVVLYQFKKITVILNKLISKIFVKINMNQVNIKNIGHEVHQEYIHLLGA